VPTIIVDPSNAAAVTAAIFKSGITVILSFSNPVDQITAR